AVIRAFGRGDDEINVALSDEAARFAVRVKCARLHRCRGKIVLKRQGGERPAIDAMHDLTRGQLSTCARTASATEHVQDADRHGRSCSRMLRQRQVDRQRCTAQSSEASWDGCATKSAILDLTRSGPCTI